MSTDNPLTLEALEADLTVSRRTAGELARGLEAAERERDNSSREISSLMAQAAKDSETIRQLREERDEAQLLAKKVAGEDERIVADLRADLADVKGRRCDHYELATLPGVSFCRKGGAQVVAEKLAELAKVAARLEEYKWEVERRDEMLHGADQDLRERNDAVSRAEAAEKALEATRGHAAQLKEALKAVTSRYVAVATTRGRRQREAQRLADAALAADDVGVAKWMESKVMAAQDSAVTDFMEGAEDGIVERIEGDFARDDRIGKALASHDAQLEAPLRERVAVLETALDALLTAAECVCPADDEEALEPAAALARAALSPAKPGSAT